VTLLSACVEEVVVVVDDFVFSVSSSCYEILWGVKIVLSMTEMWSGQEGI